MIFIRAHYQNDGTESPFMRASCLPWTEAIVIMTNASFTLMFSNIKGSIVIICGMTEIVENDRDEIDTFIWP